LALLALALSSFAASGAGTKQAETVDYGKAVRRLEQVARSELERRIVAGFSIVLVDDPCIVYAWGFGFAEDWRSNSTRTARFSPSAIPWERAGVTV
jgi:hypothetical protein